MALALRGLVVLFLSSMRLLQVFKLDLYVLLTLQSNSNHTVAYSMQRFRELNVFKDPVPSVANLLGSLGHEHGAGVARRIGISLSLSLSHACSLTLKAKRTGHVVFVSWNLEHQDDVLNIWAEKKLLEHLVPK